DSTSPRIEIVPARTAVNVNVHAAHEAARHGEIVVWIEEGRGKAIDAVAKMDREIGIDVGVVKLGCDLRIAPAACDVDVPWNTQKAVSWKVLGIADTIVATPQINM